MSIDDTMVVVKGMDAPIALADLAGLDLQNLEINRGREPFPGGLFDLRVKSIELKSLDVKDKASNDPNAKVPKAVVAAEYECVNCLSVVGSERAPEDFIGESHYEMTFITDALKDLGRVRALMMDAGFIDETAQGSILDHMDQFVGHTFRAVIKRTKDKNDPDTVYANIDPKRVQPIPETA